MGFLAVGVTPVSRGDDDRLACCWAGSAPLAEPALRCGRSQPPYPSTEAYPQQSFSPSATLMLSRPSTFLSVTSATPVS